MAAVLQNELARVVPDTARAADEWADSMSGPSGRACTPGKNDRLDSASSRPAGGDMSVDVMSAKPQFGQPRSRGPVALTGPRCPH